VWGAIHVAGSRHGLGKLNCPGNRIALFSAVFAHSAVRCSQLLVTAASGLAPVTQSAVLRRW
jgi:hypothetical protein